MPLQWSLEEGTGKRCSECVLGCELVGVQALELSVDVVTSVDFLSATGLCVFASSKFIIFYLFVCQSDKKIELSASRTQSSCV